VPVHAGLHYPLDHDLLSDKNLVPATLARAASLLFALFLTGLITGDMGTLVPALLGAAAAVWFAAWLEDRR
jgi:hypothetical protein